MCEKAPEFIRGDERCTGLSVVADRAILLKNLMKEIEEMKTNTEINDMRAFSSPVLDDERTTRLSAQEFDAFQAQLETGEKIPRFWPRVSGC